MKNIILKKRNGHALTEEEISFFLCGYTRGEIPDYQAASLLMAIYFKKMTDRETFHFTREMMSSGECYDLSKYGKACVDKHSTGGVGDNVSLICGPVVASLGIKVPMMCGRGLGHTGGTVDKLESIPGLSTRLSRKRFCAILDKVGLVYSSQTKSIAPADRKLYALRDVTGTVEDISLIISSIMSKKLATGANGIVFDVKTGAGAFMKKQKDSEKLASFLVKLSKEFKRRVIALITDMDEPLGCTVGNILEVVESVETLRGCGPKDQLDVSLEISSAMIRTAGLCNTFREARKLAKRQIENGKALKKFAEVVKAQGGDPGIIDEDYKKWKKARYVLDLASEKEGFITKLDAYAIGHLCCDLGAGRKCLDDAIDPSAGLVFFKKTGDKVKRGDLIARMYTDRNGPEVFLDALKKIVGIEKKSHKKKNKIIKRIVNI